jgi:hypothetical protein
VLDEEHRDALGFPQPVHLADHAPALVGAHAGSRLVEEQDLWVHGKRKADVEELLIAVRKIARER